jgi:Na+-translocating ferredoxin:NAD+ oxidoreductase RnfC subunit
MMGACLCNTDDPVLKTTNAITVLDKKDSAPAKETACIHCGRCVAACPHFLNPVQLANALKVDSKEERMEKFEKFVEKLSEYSGKDIKKEYLSVSWPIFEDFYTGKTNTAV